MHPYNQYETRNISVFDGTRILHARHSVFLAAPFLLSQWTASRFTVEGVSYSCAEQFFVAENAASSGTKRKREARSQSARSAHIRSKGSPVPRQQKAHMSAQGRPNSRPAPGARTQRTVRQHTYTRGEPNPKPEKRDGTMIPPAPGARAYTRKESTIPRRHKARTLFARLKHTPQMSLTRGVMHTHNQLMERTKASTRTNTTAHTHVHRPHSIPGHSLRRSVRQSCCTSRHTSTRR